MSGDVQPRKRKDKKKKKDELGIEEPRGTAAALGEGDVFMHSYSDHGTGGHWCAKIIFFSLLAILVTLIGLIILENRGLSELEANAVESRYSNILEGWLEDAPDDDHHDEHTLELKHHDDDEEDDHYHTHGEEHEDEEHADEDEEHADEDEDDEDEGNADDDEEENADDNDEENADENDDVNADEDDDSNADEDEDEEDNTQEDDDEKNDEEDFQQDLEDDEDEDDRRPYKYYSQEDDDEEDDTKDDEEAENDEQETGQDEDEENNESNEENDEDREVEGDEDEELNENDDEEDNFTKEDEDEHEDHDEEEDEELEVERIEREASEEEPISVGLPVLPEEDDDDDKDDDHDEAEEDDESKADDDEEAADDDFLEVDETPPVVERVTAPAGKPFVEVDEDDSTETPPDTLEEEEEYEKQQEELRKEEEQSSHHIWLKLTVGAALLVATHAVLRRATAPRDEPEGEREEREETPIVDRRMTLIPEEAAPTVITKKEIAKPILEEMVKSEAPVIKSPQVAKQDSEEEVEDPELEEVVEEEEVEEDEPEKLEAPKKQANKELYSDEEEEEEIIIPKKEAPKAKTPPKPASEPEEDPDDVEIIDDEQLEEELEEEDDVSDVDDTELLSRLEAKYGRLPEPERFGQKHKDGGNSVEDAWPGEPADAYWRQQLDSAEQELRQGAWSSAVSTAGAGALAGSARARYIIAAALDHMAEARRDNTLLSKAIAAYFHLLEMSERLPDKKLVEVARRTLDRIRFRGNYLKAEPVYRLLIRRFPNEPAYRNNMTISFLMANRNDLAENLLKETLAQWPDDRVALAHYAFILKTSHKDRLEEAVELFRKALDGDKGPACEPRFYYHYGDALLLLGRFKEAHEVHKRGAKLGHFLSPAQRSLYNVPRLKSHPWWEVKETPYAALARNLEKRWKEILEEGQRAAGLFKEEEEGLRERGEWGQMDLFVRGQEVPGRCKAAPVTCAVVRGEAAAAGCRRGQVKFSSMAPGTHVRPHVGPTNCRLRMHLGLANTTNTYLRVHHETRQWQAGKVLIFDDSFEHEVWHNGSGSRLVLIVDVWHPDLTAQQRRTLPPI